MIIFPLCSCFFTCLIKNYILVISTDNVYLTLIYFVFSSGDPDKGDHFGNTALHLAAARGHKDCVTFLVNFGANLYAMDIDNHTAQELAAINGRDDILRYLDSVAAKLENNDKLVFPLLTIDWGEANHRANVGLRTL